MREIREIVNEELDRAVSAKKRSVRKRQAEFGWIGDAVSEVDASLDTRSHAGEAISITGSAF
jgi:hypothetical protein